MTDTEYTREHLSFEAHLLRASQLLMRRVMRHRERYLRAWVAATGHEPTDAVLIQRKGFDGLGAWESCEVVSRAEFDRRFGRDAR